MTNPNADIRNYRTLLVSAPFQNLEERKVAEDALVEEFSKLNLVVLRAIDIIPPVKEYSNEEFKTIFAEKNIDGVLIVQLTDAYTKTTYQSRSQTTYNPYTGINTQTNTNAINKPRREYAVNIYDSKTSETVWMSTSVTKGNAFADEGTLLKSLAYEIASTFKKDVGL
jgi:hypothetical protein